MDSERTRNLTGTDKETAMDSVIMGRVVTPEGTHSGWVAVRGEKIAEIGAGVAPSAATVVDYGDCLILPGSIDGQTHATNSKGLVGFAPASASALAGGVTTIVDMPYDMPLPLDIPERLAAKISAVAAHSLCDVALYATVTKESGLDHVEALIEGGVVAFKISSFESSPVRFPRIDEALTLDLLEKLVGRDLPLGLHNEDQEIVRSRTAKARAAGRDGIGAHSDSRPLAAELAATGQFLALGQAVGAHAHIVHISHEEGFAQVGAFAGIGAPVTGELCVHYLCFDPAHDGDLLGARMKVNPPIRPDAIDGLWRALECGTVAFVSSDHASWPIDNKLAVSIYEAGAGIPGLETLVPAFFSAAQARGHDAARLTAEYLAARPARFFGLSGRKGALAPGLDADFCVLEQGEFIWDAAKAHDGLNWSPFDGRRFDVRVAATWLRGKPAWNGSQILLSQGNGQYLRRHGLGWFPTH
ncbi:amidohydrolase family protein [Sinorhizobium medicae]|nr:amidohydrolase family protein [Sinorhizobium medicae]